MTAFAGPRGQVVSRFAPSPTGRLHLGHAYSALLAHDTARAASGHFLLRIEDIDGGRCRREFVDRLLDDLVWLGLKWDAPPLTQSSRADAHTGALARLQQLGLVYACVCTRADIAASAGAPQGDQPALYPGTCRGRRIDASRPHAWRLDMTAAIARVGTVSWQDAVAGEIVAQPELFGDVVVARKDAGSSYHLAATVDDAHQGVTHIVRGRDLFAATHVHRLLQALLELPVPTYRHHALIMGPDGRRLAKRTPGATLADLRAEGVDPRKLVELMRQDRLPVGFRFDAP